MLVKVTLLQELDTADIAHVVLHAHLDHYVVLQRGLALEALAA